MWYSGNLISNNCFTVMQNARNLGVSFCSSHLYRVIRIPAQEKKILDEKICKMELLGATEVGKVKMESSVYRSLSDQGK